MSYPTKSPDNESLKIVSLPRTDIRFVLQAPGNTKADLKASMDNPLTRLATLQAELKDSQRVLAQLEEAGTALQAGADEYNRLIGELRERKDRHSALKVQSRDLKKVKRQYQAKERALRELLEL